MKRLFLSSTALYAMALFAAPNDKGTMSFLGSAGGPEGSADGVTIPVKQVGNQQGKTSAGIKMLGSDPALETASGIIGFTGKVSYVNKKEAEGLLAIDAFTGVVIMNAETPEWATDIGLVSAVLTERHSFYASRLGQQYADTHVSPEVYAFEDLAWLSLVDDGADGTEAIIDADTEHRMDVLSAVLNVDRDTGDIKDVLVSMEFQSDNTRTEAELAALEEATQKPQAVEAQG